MSVCLYMCVVAEGAAGAALRRKLQVEWQAKVSLIQRSYEEERQARLKDAQQAQRVMQVPTNQTLVFVLPVNPVQVESVCVMVDRRPNTGA